ncbi:MAG: hypothetical protein HY553_05015 [Elusimicrobia bacterium]|nr:hypothetical protein [Elusimicrobiota bacterium]
MVTLRAAVAGAFVCLAATAWSAEWAEIGSTGWRWRLPKAFNPLRIGSDNEEWRRTQSVDGRIVERLKVTWVKTGWRRGQPYPATCPPGLRAARPAIEWKRNALQTWRYECGAVERNFDGGRYSGKGPVYVSDVVITGSQGKPIEVLRASFQLEWSQVKERKRVRMTAQAGMRDFERSFPTFERNPR